MLVATVFVFLLMVQARLDASIATVLGAQRCLAAVAAEMSHTRKAAALVAAAIALAAVGCVSWVLRARRTRHEERLPRIQAQVVVEADGEDCGIGCDGRARRFGRREQEGQQQEQLFGLHLLVAAVSRLKANLH